MTTNTNTNETITGHDAIAYAEARGLTLNKYADPIEDARTGLDADKAREIASEDPSLIWVERIDALHRAAVRDLASHKGEHVCLDGRRYRGSACLVTDYAARNPPPPIGASMARKLAWAAR